jgi:hypothetical protein
MNEPACAGALRVERIEGNGVQTIIVETASRFARDLMVQEVGYSGPYLERTRSTAMIDELPFRVVRNNSHDETLARCTNLPIVQAAYRAAARMYPDELIELRQGARVIEKSKG